MLIDDRLHHARDLFENENEGGAESDRLHDLMMMKHDLPLLETRLNERMNDSNDSSWRTDRHKLIHSNKS